MAQVTFVQRAAYVMKDAKRGAKTESLSLRIDPKTKFILDFMVKVTGYRITDLIERAIKDAADKTTVPSDSDFASDKTWIDYWHSEEGVRTLNVIFDKKIRTTFEEDELADFVDQHARFFFTTEGSGRRKPITAFVQVLWPKIDEYLDHWRETKSASRWATGIIMLEAIKKADMKGPDWPIHATASKQPTSASTRRGDLDDEIPF